MSILVDSNTRVLGTAIHHASGLEVILADDLDDAGPNILAAIRGVN